MKKSHEELIDKILEQLRDDDDGDLELVGSYSHNIISLILQQIAESYGDEKAHAAILDCNLDELGWEVKKAT